MLWDNKLGSWSFFAKNLTDSINRENHRLSTRKELILYLSKTSAPENLGSKRFFKDDVNLKTGLFLNFPVAPSREAYKQAQMLTKKNLTVLQSCFNTPIGPSLLPSESGCEFSKNELEQAFIVLFWALAIDWRPFMRRVQSSSHYNGKIGIISCPDGAVLIPKAKRE